MVYQYLLDFSDWTNITVLDQTDGDSTITINSNPFTVTDNNNPFNNGIVDWQFDNINGWGLRNIDWELYFRCKLSDTSPNDNSSIVLQMNFTMTDGTSDQAYSLIHVDGTRDFSNLVGTGVEFDGQTANFSLLSNRWRWFRIESNVVGNDRQFRISTNEEGVTTKPTSWDVRFTVTLTNGKDYYMKNNLIDFDLRTYTTFVNSEPFEFDDFELYAANGPYVDVVNASFANYHSYLITTGVSKIGLAQFQQFDYWLASKATHLAQQLATLTVSDLQGTTRFKGEIKRVRTQLNMVQFECMGYGQKLNRTPCDVDIIQDVRYIRSVVPALESATGCYIYDNNITMTLNEYQGMIATLVQQDPRVVKLDPIHTFAYVSVPTGTFTPDDTAGAIGNLYFNDTTLSDDNNRLSAEEAAGSGNAIELRYAIPRKKDTTITRITLDFVISGRRGELNPTLTGQLPAIYAFDFTNNEYNTSTDLVYQVTKSEYQTEDREDTFGRDESVPIAIQVDVVISSDYLANNYITASASDEFDSVDFRLAVEMTAYGLLIDSIHIHKALIEVEFDTDQDPEQSRFYIDANTTGRLELLADQTWEDRGPKTDGFGIGDTLYISKTVEDILTEIFSTSDISLSLSQNITGADQFGVTTEYKNKYIWDFVQWVKDTFNCEWWIDYATDTFTIQSIDNLVSSNFTITYADIPDFEADSFFQLWDAQDLPDKIRVVGDEIEYTHTTSPEYSHTLGTETLIIDDSNINTRAEAIERAEKVAAMIENSRRQIQISIAAQPSGRNYSALALGKKVALALPTEADTSIANYTSGGDGELLITDIQFERNENTGNIDRFILDLRRVYT